jgi:hypothetical protein
MKVVQSVPFGVKGCAVTGRSGDREGFIETTSKATGDRLHISAEAVKIMGHEFGMLPKDEALANRSRIFELEQALTEANDTIARNERLEIELVEARETLAEAEKTLAVFAELGEQGYTAETAKELQADLESIQGRLADAQQTIAKLDDALERADALANRRKVLA